MRLKSVLLLYCVLTALPLVAQKVTGTIQGVVTDQSGAVIPGAKVTIINTQTGATRTEVSSTSGEYIANDLAPGMYELHARATSFGESIVKDLELHVSSSAVANIKMRVGAASAEVTVEANAVQVETTTGAVGNVVNGEQVRELPLNGRNFVQLTTMMPGAAVAENFDPKNKGLLAGVDISFSGAAANGNQWLVDGASNNDVGSQRTILIYPSIDAIEEFKILRNSYGPEFGGAGGAQVNIVTRGGGNDFHGTAYYFGRNDALNSKSYQLSSTDHKQLLRRNDYGYNFGGPIKKDKAFFFWSQEWNREKRARVRSQQVPTAAERTGDFNDLAGCPALLPKDPRTGLPFPNNQIPAVDLSPAGQAFLSQVSLPTRSDPCKINWVQGVTIPVNWREENVRGDLNITKSTVLTLRYTQDAWVNLLHSDEEGGLWGEQGYPSISGNWDQPGKVAIAKLTTTLGTTAVNDFAFSWSANRIIITKGGDNPGLDNTIKAALPYVYPASGKLHGAATASPLFWGGSTPGGIIGHYGPWKNGQDLFAWKDDFSKVVGRHSFKVGGVFSTNKKDEETGAEQGGFWGNGNGTGAYYDNPATGLTNNWGGTTGNEYGDYLLKGTLFGYGENARDGTAQARWKDLELYVGDSWKARPHLTLEYGVRYSLTPPVYDAADRYSGFRPDLYDPALQGAECNGIVLPKGAANACPAGTGGTVGKYRGLVPTNYHLFAPRLGFAWDVFGTGKFALRGGVGQFFARDPISILVQVEGVNSPFAVAGNGLRTLDGPLCSPGDAGCTKPTLINFSVGGSPTSGLENNNRAANNWQWNLTTETALWRNAKLELGWVALRGIHLQSSQNLNQVAPANRVAFFNAGVTNSNPNQYYPYHALTNAALGQFTHNADSVYHSLQATFQSKLTQNSQVQTSYTWSKNIADTTLEYIGPGNGIADTYNSRVGRGNADFDRRHIFNGSIIYNLPQLKGYNGFVQGALGGWETSSILNFYSGAALRITGTLSGVCDMDLITKPTGTTNDCNPTTGIHPLVGGSPWGIGNAASGSSAPNRNYSQPCHASSSGNRTQWLNPSAFTFNGFKIGGYPNDSPGSCAGPGVQDVDFSTSKNWALHGSRFLGDNSRLQFRLEFFNLFNHPMFRNTNNGFSSSGGTITNGVIDCSSNSCSNTNTNFGLANTPSNIGNREIQYALKLIF